MIKSRKQMFIIISVFALILFLGGTTYAWFNYSRTSSNNVLVTGNIYLTFIDDNNITLTNVFPETAEEARSKNNNFITFEINGVNETNRTLYYEIDLNHGTDKANKTRFNDSDLRFDLIELDSNGNEVKYLLDEASFDTLINKRIWADSIDSSTSMEVSRKYKLRMWLSSDVIVSDTDPLASYPATGFKDYYANVNLTVIGDFNEKIFAYQKVLKSIEDKENDTNVQCSDITYEEDGITYLSGDNNCIDMNYVWYSGKLWRITAIYPDGTMKLITEDMITSIQWGSDTEYDGSWVYQWLNEDFYDTLYNANNIIENGTWNYSTDENSIPVRPETIEIQKTKTAPVGLLNAYEYYNSFRCIGSDTCTSLSYSTSYLNIGCNWWLITPYSTSNLRVVVNAGFLYYYSPSSSARGVRPSIVIKSGLEFTGDGSKSSPYIIKEDTEDVVNNTTLLSSRSIGEYVKFNNDLYRIVDTSDGITKLTRVDYLREDGTVITKNLSSTVYFGKSTNAGSDTYWDYYLNNTWYNSISSTYKNMLVDGIYYLGFYSSNTNYKATICKDADLNSVITKNCTKYTSTDTDKTWTGKVGLPRVGEMFSSQLGSGYSTSNIWLITPYFSSYVRSVGSTGNLNGNWSSSDALGVRPSITLKSGIKITGGTGYVGGDVDSPFEISE